MSDRLTDKDVINLHELIGYANNHGLVSLPTYARIWYSREKAAGRYVPTDPATWERNFRRLQAKLKTLLYDLPAEHKGELLQADFARDTALRAEVERRVAAIEAKNTCEDNSVQSVDDSEETGSVEILSAEALAADRGFGLSLRALCKRYQVSERKVVDLLHALGVERRKPGPMLLTERKSLAMIERAVERGRTGYGSVTDLARALGCHRNTARVVMRKIRKGGE